jgi:hypothetical protein
MIFSLESGGPHIRHILRRGSGEDPWVGGEIFLDRTVGPWLTSAESYAKPMM